MRKPCSRMKTVYRRLTGNLRSRSKEGKENLNIEDQTMYLMILNLFTFILEMIMVIFEFGTFL